MRIKWFTGFLILLLCCLLKIPVSAEEPSKLLYQELKYKDNEIEVVVSGKVPENATLYVYKYNDVTYEGNDNNYYSDFGINLSITVDDELWNPSSDNSVLNVCIINGKDYINDADNFTCYYLGDNSKVSNARIVDNNIVFSTDSIGIYTFGKTEHSSLSQRTFVRRIGKYTITISGKMPDDANPVVEQVYNYNELENKIDNDDYNIELAFDIKITSCGEEWQPIDYGEELTVTFSNLDIEAGEDKELKVYRVIDEEQMDSLSEAAVENNVQEVEQMNSEVSDDNCIISFETDHFTTYTIGTIITDADTETDAYLCYGWQFAWQLKKLVNPSLVDAAGADNTITDIIWVDTPFTSDCCLTYYGYGNGGTQTAEIYARLNDTTVELYTSAQRVYLNNINSSGMFQNFRALRHVDLSKFDATSATNLAEMFMYCMNLQSIDFSNGNWDTANVTNMSGMFYKCSKLTSLDVSKFNTSKVSNMGYMFWNCSSLTSLDLSSFNTVNATNMNAMFTGCSSLASVVFGDTFNTSNVTDMGYMFCMCPLLTTLDVSRFNTANVTNMVYMFHSCSSLTSLDISKFNTSNVTDMSSMFYNCSKLTSLDVSKFDTSKVTTMGYMFWNCSSLTSLNLSSFNTANVTNMNAMFTGCSSLTSVVFGNEFDTSNVTDMGYMFYKCFKLADLDVSKFNTANVTNMVFMFHSCSSLTDLDVSKFNTANVANMSGMFYKCSKLTSLDVSKFNTAKVTDMSYMFWNCSLLTTIDVSGLNTSKVTNMCRMFSGCSSLTSLDVSKFNTINVTDMESMFYGCRVLTSLDVSKFDTSKVTDMSGMFKGCSKLKELDLSESNLLNLTKADDVFTGTGLLKIKSPNRIADGVTISLPSNGNWYIDDIEKFNKADTDDKQTSFDCNRSHTYISSLNPDFKPATQVAMFYYGLNENVLLKSFVNPDLKQTVNEIDNAYDWYAKRDIVDNKITNIVWSDIPFDTSADGVKLVGETHSGYEPIYGRAVKNTKRDTITKVSHTDNVSDSGSYSGSYTANTTKTETVTIPGAKSITVDLSYSMDSNTTVSVYKGTNTSGELLGTYSDYVTTVVGILPLGSLKQSTLNVEGDSVTIVFTAGSNNSSLIFRPQRFGYYAKVYGEGDVELDTYSIELYTEADIVYTNNCIDHLFNNFQALEHVDILSSKIVLNQNTITSDHIFRNDSSLIDVDLSRFDFTTFFKGYDETCDFDRVPTLSGLFEGCTSLINVNFGNANTSKIEDMHGMFIGCTSLQNIDISNFDTSNVKDFSAMFAFCTSLEDIIGLSNLDTTSATDMTGMFNMCIKLDSIDVSNFNTENVVKMTGMFVGCSSIKSLDVSNMNLSNVEDMSYMFAYCTSLEEIKMPDAYVSNVYPYMFMFTPHLSKLYGLQNVSMIHNNSFVLNTYIPKELYNTQDDEFKYIVQQFKDVVTMTDVGDYYYLQSVEPSSKVILQFPDYKQYKSDCWLNYDWTSDNRAVCEYEVTTPAVVDLESAEIEVDVRSYVGQENIDVNVNKVNTLSSVVDNSKKLNLYLKTSDRDKSTSSLTGKYNLKDLVESEDNISYIAPVKEKDSDGIYNMHEKYIFNFIRESSPDLGEYNGSIGIEFSKDVGALNAG